MSESSYNINFSHLQKKAKPLDKTNCLNQLSQMTNLDDEFKLKLISYLLELSGDRNELISNTANTIVKSYVGNINKFLIKSMIKEILCGLDNNCNSKTKLTTLQLLNLVSEYDNFRSIIPLLIEPLTDTMVDLNKDCANSAHKLFELIYTKIDNTDINPLVPFLVNSASDPTKIPETIDKLSSTTFVQNVDSQTLSVIVPLLLKTFQNATNSVKRQTIVIIENMTKLVEDPYHALLFIEKLLPILAYAKNEIADPEVRQVGNRAYEHLLKIDVKGKQLKLELESKLESLYSVYNFNSNQKEILDVMIDSNNFSEENLSILNVNNEIVNKLLTLYNEKFTSNANKLEEENATKLCSCEFTLGYGSKVLLHKTKLELYKGFKYGLIGSNNSGKSTLMRAMATRQLESFPQELKSVYVETDILGELSHLSLVDYILQDERLKEENLTQDRVEQSLRNFAFTEQMLSGGVSTLSGGWRMKLALARAMMQNADILLMDEPSAHLDVMNVRWLLDYIRNLKDVTCIIVSQNAKLLDECCTHMIHISNLKLHQSKGNLSEFVKSNPEAQSYFELKTEKYSFKFPQPRFLDGVKSKGKALMKMENVTFTYPGNSAPTVKNATVQVSLASRIGCLGPNGAGKSTSIKILTGQLEPQQGTVWTYPGLKIGYIAQHAFAHIEAHLDKTPNEYIRWRYDGGEDKEDLKKITMKMTEEEEAKLKKEILIDMENGSKIKKQIKRLTYGRRVGKREREYEVELENSSQDLNQWLSETDLQDRGYAKLLKIIDSKCDAAEGGFQMALTQQNVEEHLEKIGMTKENATHVKIKQLSNGEKVKVVIGAALWMLPHILILDEPTNNIDRDGLAALKEAINEFEGGVIIITHDEQFCNSICKEIWVIENFVLNIKGDPEWMSNALKTKIETKAEEEMIDANGNIMKVKQPKKKLTRKEKMARQKYKQMLRDQGEVVSDDSDDE
jgi:elongation factor 3